VSTLPPYPFLPHPTPFLPSPKGGRELLCEPLFKFANAVASKFVRELRTEEWILASSYGVTCALKMSNWATVPPSGCIGKIGRP
jgi:hypothetical protein